MGTTRLAVGSVVKAFINVDGASVNANENNVVSLVPTQDAVQEFRYPPTRSAPNTVVLPAGVINFGTKSGTTVFTAAAYEYARKHRFFDANDWFQHHKVWVAPALHQIKYGANLGGPIPEEQDLFSSFSWEHERVTSASPCELYLSDDLMR